MRSVRLLTAALLSVVGLVAVGATTQSASANSLVMTSTYSSVMKYENFTLSGKVLTPKVRTIKLQYKSGTKWVDKMSKTTFGDGSFYFNTFTGATRYYRYYAPKSGTSAAIVGNTKKITLVAQKVTAYITPNPVVYYCSTNYVGTVNMVITAYPARAGRGVTFMTPNGVEENEGSTDAHGHAVVPFAINKQEGTYKVTATVDANNGASAASAAPASIVLDQRFLLCP